MASTARRRLTGRGTQRTASALKTLERQVQARAHVIAELIVEHIKNSPTTPRLTGDLAKGYYVDTDDNGDAVIKTDVRYWQFVEYGTGNHEAQPHIRPAVDLVRAELRL